LLDCDHCGHRESVDHGEPIVLSRRRRGDVTVEQIARVDFCRVCSTPTLLTYEWVKEVMDLEDVDLVQLYPEQGWLWELPSRVQERYREMLEAQDMPDAFATRAGKTLEAICADQGIGTSGRQKMLAGRLDALVAKGGMSYLLVRQLRFVREFRNLAGHDAPLDVRGDDVRHIRQFVQNLLDFLYWEPKRLASLEHRFDLRMGLGMAWEQIEREEPDE
jgi:hypothetical protein